MTGFTDVNLFYGLETSRLINSNLRIENVMAVDTEEENPKKIKIAFELISSEYFFI